MATIKQIKDTNGNIHDILSTIGYGTCATAAATAAKVATISDTSWTLKVGSIIGIKFTNSNSAGSSKTPVTLNVNSTGAKNIWYDNAKYTGTNTSICGYANRVLFYMYDGTYWVWINMGSLDGNSDTKTSTSEKASTKLFLVGATTQATSGQTTYSNSKCYVGTDNCLYSNGSKVSTDGHTHDDIYVKKSGDTMTGNLTLHADSGISPYLKFNRGTSADNLCDWTIVDEGGYLRFKETINGKTTEILSMCGSGGKITTPLNIKGTTFEGNVTGNCSGSSGSCTGNAATATTATNLAMPPKLAASGNNITVTAGGKTSDEFTVPYATTANTAINLAPSPSLAASGNNITVTAGGKTSGAFTVPYATKAGSATNDSDGNNISTTYVKNSVLDDFATYADETYATKSSSLKNPYAIKFKNTSGTVVTYDGSSAADLSGGVYYAATAGGATYATNAISATTATNLAEAPSLAADGSNITVTAGGKISDVFTVPYATKAGSATYATKATSATTATNANNVMVNTTSTNDGLPIVFTTFGSSAVAANKALYMDSTKSLLYNPNQNTVTCAGGFFDTSDERLKDIVNPITVDLDKLSKLRKVYFNWKDKPDSNLQLGMIAQDVQELYPELVSELNGQLSLSYEKLSVIALEAIDVLHNENNELKSRIERLESLVNQLAEKVND